MVVGVAMYAITVACLVAFVFLACAAAVEVLDVQRQIQTKTAGSRAGDPAVNSGLLQSSEIIIVKPRGSHEE